MVPNVIVAIIEHMVQSPNERKTVRPVNPARVPELSVVPEYVTRIIRLLATIIWQTLVAKCASQKRRQFVAVPSTSRVERDLRDNMICAIAALDDSYQAMLLLCPSRLFTTPSTEGCFDSCYYHSSIPFSEIFGSGPFSMTRAAGIYYKRPTPAVSVFWIPSLSLSFLNRNCILFG